MTEITQPAILTASVAAWRVLQSKGITPQYVAGHSLGEYSAHVAAGTLDFADAVRTVSKRGKYMQEAVPAGVGAMAAILMLPADEVRKSLRRSSRGRSLPGREPQLSQPDRHLRQQGRRERAAELAKKRGAKRAVMLPVSAPFHCALMQPAQDRLGRGSAKASNFRNPEIPVLSNVDVELVTTADAARDTLTRQVTGAVQWDASMRKLIALGVNTFVEVGPGAVLSGLMRQIDKSQTCFNVEDEDSLQKAMNGLLTNAGQEG